MTTRYSIVRTMFQLDTMNTLRHMSTSKASEHTRTSSMGKWRKPVPRNGIGKNQGRDFSTLSSRKVASFIWSSLIIKL
jgi:hypothetical protein